MSGIVEKPMRMATGKLHIELRGPDGKLKEERFVHNIITNAGDAHVADQMSDGGENPMSHMAIGTDDDPAPAVGDTTLNSQLDRNALTSVVQGTAGDDNDVIYVGDWAAGDGTGTIVEAGIFNNSSGGTMLCRAIFTAIPKGGSDTLKITWTVTFGAS